jgi:23S rRNA (cytidine2498-2'-O)-methyltransferase
LKIEEALLWSGLPVRPGDVAVEAGSAPGGASYALLERGMRVVGIDPAEMAPSVLRRKSFQHLRKIAQTVTREDLPAEVHWVLLDMNVEPRIALAAIDRIAGLVQDSLLGVVLTVKLNRWDFADEIPRMIEFVRGMGMSRVRVAQLANNRREITFAGLTRKGMARKR